MGSGGQHFSEHGSSHFARSNMSTLIGAPSLPSTSDWCEGPVFEAECTQRWCSKQQIYQRGLLSEEKYDEFVKRSLASCFSMAPCRRKLLDRKRLASEIKSQDVFFMKTKSPRKKPKSLEVVGLIQEITSVPELARICEGYTESNDVTYNSACTDSQCALVDSFNASGARSSPSTRNCCTQSHATVASFMQKGLPDEVLLKICSFASPSDLCRLSRTCKRLQTICNDESLWKKLFWNCFRMAFPIRRTESANMFEVVKLISGPGRPDASWKSYFPLLFKAHHVTKDSMLSASLSQYGRKCHSKIQDAVDASGTDGLVLVHSGTYCESVDINKSVAMIGTGLPGTEHEVRLTNLSDTVIQFGPNASNAHVAFFCVTMGNDLEASSARCHCIEVCNDSTPTVQDCHVTSKSSNAAAIYVHGNGSCPRFLRCKLYDCHNVGLYLNDGAQGVYEDNEVVNNRLAGVWVKSGANPIMRRNEVHHGRDAGFFIFDGGLGYYEENNVHSNRIAGIEVRSGANPTVVHCEIHHGSTGGIYVHDDGRGEFMNNRIHNNTFAGVWVTSGSNPTIKDNEIYHGQQGGIYVFGEGRGLLENNDIHGNALAGIQIRSNSNPIVRRNRIHHGMHGGIYVHEGGLGLIENNEIYANTLAGIWITTGSAPILRQNRIHSGKQVGVYFYDKGCGTLEDNEIYNHKYSGIQIRSGSNPVIRRNKIWGGKNGGVLIYNGGLGILDENEIFDNAMAGVWIKTESNPILRRNKIHDGHEGGVCIFNSGRGLLEENDIFRNSLTGVLISTSSFPVLRKNRIFDGGAAGIEITNGAGGILEKNEIFNNRFDAICLATGVCPKLNDNKCHDNKRALNEAVQAGKCLYQVSGSVCYPMHDFYKCTTCSSTENLAICVNCIETCHQGHVVEFVRHDRFFCDCGAGTTSNPCKLTSAAPQNSTCKTHSPLTGRSPRAQRKRSAGGRIGRSRSSARFSQSRTSSQLDEHGRSVQTDRMPTREPLSATLVQ